MFRAAASVAMVVIAGASAQPAAPSADHWSFKPFSKQALPQVKDTAWPRGRVDRFVLATLESRGLAPSADADPATLIRRAFFDLTGLPPSPEEIEAFLREAGGHGLSSSWAALLDRLLASPEFGARWGRHWLDVARFAETSGNTRNMAYVLAWRYRNYVVRSFNRDTPFDEFAREQIAGDLLVPAADPARRDDQLLATGFLNVGVKSLGEQDMTLYDMNVVDEQITANHAGVPGAERELRALPRSQVRSHPGHRLSRAGGHFPQHEEPLGRADEQRHEGGRCHATGA